jgi:C4-dicarboxylate-specific signal transduction histidine kinase
VLSTLVARLFNPSGFTPHGFCLLWQPWLIWTEVIGNAVIGVSYFSIPLVLTVFVRGRPDLVFRPIAWLFAAFILLCGLTHWLDVLTLWEPAYGIQAVFIAATAAASVSTALASGLLLPKALRLPSSQQLHEAKVALVASARLSALGEMAGGIAHEINNPLAVIHALASDLVEQGNATPDEIAECGQRIVEYADRITKIVRSLRHIARDGERDPYDEASVSEIVGRALDVCAERFRQNSVDLLTSPIDPELRLRCREVQISQLLVNLLQNAFDAVEERQGEKWVRLEVADYGESVIIAVIDSGNGVPAELKERIMEPFFTTKPVGKGTGLGLSLSRQIAAEHGGTLKLGEWDGHTCFSLGLPVIHDARAACN